jgi:hypothetical protein
VESAIFRNIQGLDGAQRKQLEGQAQRWKFELKTWVAEFLEEMYFPTYITVIIALVGLSFSALRSKNRPRSVVVSAVINVLALLPACVLFRMSVLGMSPIAQFNADTSAAMALWSAWFRLWGFFMPMLLTCLIVAVGAALTFLASHWRWTALQQAKLACVYIALTLVHCWFAPHWIASNAPDA